MLDLGAPSLAGNLWRRPLRLWAHDLRVAAERLTTVGSRLAHAHGVADVFNQLALVQAYAGDLPAASMSCLTHLEWQLEGWRTSGSIERFGLALQPHVNLIRLEARQGRGDAARQSLEHLRSAMNGRANLPLGHTTVTAEEWRRVAPDPLIAGFVQQVFVRDTLQSLTNEHRWEQAAAFADAIAAEFPTDSGLSLLVDDVAVFALLHTGALSKALPIIFRLQTGVGFARVLGLTYRAAARRREGTRADGILDTAAQECRDLMASSPPTRPLTLLLLYIAEQALADGAADVGLAAAKVVRSVARAAPDESLETASSHLLKMSTPGESTLAPMDPSDLRVTCGDPGGSDSLRSDLETAASLLRSVSDLKVSC